MLNPILRSSMADRLIFMDDKARPHGIIQEAIDLPFPLKSRQSSSMGLYWCKVNQRNPQYQNNAELGNAILNERRRFPQEIICILVLIMNMRVREHWRLTWYLSSLLRKCAQKGFSLHSFKSSENIMTRLFS